MRTMMRTKLVLVAAMVLLLAAVPVLAHHSLAAKYDTRQSVLLKGTVTRITWDNPHVHLYLQAADKQEPDAGWEFEMGSPNLLILNGWKLDTFRRGDYVLVTAYPARDGSMFGYATKVALSTP
jgi:uncharacterized protein DUF6152